MNDTPPFRHEADEATRAALRDIVRRYGTPTYAFDVRRLQAQVDKLRSRLPEEVDVLYSLKANASLGVCDVFADSGLGADVASAGEIATALEAGFAPERMFVAGPFKSRETIASLLDYPAAVVSVDSTSEARALAHAGLRNPIALRLRPDFGSCAVVPAGSESRFGFTSVALEQDRAMLCSLGLNLVGFHVFAGSQVLEADRVNEHLRRSLDLCLRAADVLGIQPSFLNLGGGFGIPYGPGENSLDLECVGKELTSLVARAAPARLMLELGRYLVAEAGWYLTSVVGHQAFQGGPAVVVDGGVHQRADVCGVDLRGNQLPPLVLDGDETQCTPTSVLGCLSLPADLLIESSPLPPLAAGDVLAFGRAGAYGLWSSPVLFHGSPLPAEVAFDGGELHLMRRRKPSHSILDDQHHVTVKLSTHA